MIASRLNSHLEHIQADEGLMRVVQPNFMRDLVLCTRNGRENRWTWVVPPALNERISGPRQDAGGQAGDLVHIDRR